MIKFLNQYLLFSSNQIKIVCVLPPAAATSTTQADPPPPRHNHSRHCTSVKVWEKASWTFVTSTSLLVRSRCCIGADLPQPPGQEVYSGWSHPGWNENKFHHQTSPNRPLHSLSRRGNPLRPNWCWLLFIFCTNTNPPPAAASLITGCSTLQSVLTFDFPLLNIITVRWCLQEGEEVSLSGGWVQCDSRH